MGSTEPGNNGTSSASKSLICLKVPLVDPSTQVPNAPSTDRVGSKSNTIVFKENLYHETGVYPVRYVGDDDEPDEATDATD